MNDGSDAAIVRLEHVSKEYGGSVLALDRTDLDLREGEFVTLLGPSGSGKTTLLNIVAGMVAPTAGRVWIGGRDVTEIPPEKRGLGMVFQNYALMPHMTVYENVAFPLRIRRRPRADIDRRVHQVLELVRLPGIAWRKPKELSGGQQQRVSLARCIVYNPNLILMDEPLGALDKKLREQMQLEIKRLHTELGITMLYVTHDQEEALNMSDRIVLMRAGRTEQVGTPHELYFAPRNVFVADFVGQSSLLAATLVERGSVGTLRLADAQTCWVPECDHRIGTIGKLLLRPEALSLVDRSAAPTGYNALDGTLANTLATGGMVKHFIELADGSAVIVQELANRNASRFAKGQELSVVWPIEAGRFLAEA